MQLLEFGQHVFGTSDGQVGMKVLPHIPHVKSAIIFIIADITYLNFINLK